MAVKSYNPASVFIIVGPVPIVGYADGTFITAGRVNDAFTMGSGADGEGWRAKSNDRTGVITLTLLQSSLSNVGLSALAALDETSGDGVVPFLMKDISGTTILAAETCWITKFADVERARELSTVEWSISTDSLIMTVGGIL